MPEIHMKSVHFERGGSFKIPDGHSVFAVEPNPSRTTEVLVFYGEDTDDAGEQDTTDEQDTATTTSDDASPEEWMEAEMEGVREEQTDDTPPEINTHDTGGGDTEDRADPARQTATGQPSIADVEDMDPDAPVQDVPGAGEATLEAMQIDPDEYTAGDLPASYYALAEMVGKDAADTIERFADGVHKS